MQGYVAKATAGQAQPSSKTAGVRRAMKVPVPRATNNQRRQNQAAQDEQDKRTMEPGAAPQLRPLSRGKQVNGRGLFDTDAESIGDTTVSSTQIGDVQISEQSPSAMPHLEAETELYQSPDIADEDLQRALEAAEHIQENVQVQEQLQYGVENEFYNRVQLNQDREERSVFAGGESYPATTSGGPEDEEGATEEEGLFATQPAASHHFQHISQQDRRNLGTNRMSSQVPLYDRQAAQRQYRSHGTRKKENDEIAATKMEQVHNKMSLPMRESSPMKGASSTQPVQQLRPYSIGFQQHRPYSVGAQQKAQPPVVTSVEKARGPRKPTGQQTWDCPANDEPVSRNAAQTQQQEDEQSELNIDYPPKELIEMPYSALQEQSFDFDPNDPKSGLPPGADKNSLAERLAAAQKLDPERQRAFFSTLPIVEWEEAGDWFLDQFAGLIASFRNARRRKREAARDFESELHARHEAVEKRKRIIETAMADMKVDGQGLLRATTPAPKRRRTGAPRE